MPFEKRFKELVSTTPIISEVMLLERSLLASFLVYATMFAYKYMEVGVVSLRAVNLAAAWTSVILISLSFALSGLCYFWNFADRYILYRKHIGLVGFGYGMIHVLLTLFVLSKRYNLVTYFLSEDHFLPFLYGVAAVAIFTMMTAISNRFAVHELGTRLWRAMLRMGYIGLLFVLLHFAFLGIDKWTAWFTGDLMALPPLGIILSVTTIGVFVLRIALEYSVRKKRREAEMALEQSTS
jgi:DMSO/TMAO reductase YedYZ heme-binding membrane subunit